MLPAGISHPATTQRDSHSLKEVLVCADLQLERGNGDLAAAPRGLLEALGRQCCDNDLVLPDVTLYKNEPQEAGYYRLSDLLKLFATLVSQ